MSEPPAALSGARDSAELPAAACVPGTGGPVWKFDRSRYLVRRKMTPSARGKIMRRIAQPFGHAFDVAAGAERAPGTRQHDRSDASLKNEGIDAPVGADIQAILARYQGLEVVKSTHRLASENSLAGVTAKPMKPIVAFSADNPHDGI